MKTIEYILNSEMGTITVTVVDEVGNHLGGHSFNLNTENVSATILRDKADELLLPHTAKESGATDQEIIDQMRQLKVDQHTATHQRLMAEVNALPAEQVVFGGSGVAFASGGNMTTAPGFIDPTIGMILAVTILVAGGYVLFKRK